MLQTFGLVALILSLVLNICPAKAASQVQPVREPAVQEQVTVVPAQDIVVLWLYVIQNGRLEKWHLASDELAGMAELSVNGYIHGILALSKTSLEIDVNQKPVHTIERDFRGYFKIKNYGLVEPNTFWDTFLADEMGRIPIEQVQNCYALFPKVPGDMLSKTRQLKITVRSNGARRSLSIRQNAPRQIETPTRLQWKTPPCLPEIYLIGTGLNQSKGTSSDLKARLGAILDGVATVQAATGRKIVEKVYIIDYDGPRNAYTLRNEAVIWLYNSVFFNETQPELRMMAEHEAMHILSDQLKLPGNSRMRELFATLMDFRTSSPEHRLVLTTGHPLNHSSRVTDAKISHLFDFINETNFIRGTNGGHARDNMDEFCASFLHTLLYIDRLKPLLGHPVISQNGYLIKLSDLDRNVLLKDYQRVLKTIIDEVPEPLSAPLMNLLQACLETSRQVSASQ